MAVCSASDVDDNIKSYQRQTKQDNITTISKNTLRIMNGKNTINVGYLNEFEDEEERAEGGLIALNLKITGTCKRHQVMLQNVVFDQQCSTLQTVLEYVVNHSRNSMVQ